MSLNKRSSSTRADDNGFAETASSAARVQLKRTLTGKPYDAQIQMLRPPIPMMPGTVPQRSAAGATQASLPEGTGAVQRKQSVQGMLVQCSAEHEGAHIPDASTQNAVHSELYPAATGAGGAAATWDGASDPVTGVPSAAALSARTALSTQMTTAMTAHLANAMTAVRAIVSQRRLPQWPKPRKYQINKIIARYERLNVRDLIIS